MIEGSLGLIVEGLLSTLLVATIFYCISVNRKLERLRDEQKGMHQFIRELSVATAKADKAIQGLCGTVQDSGEELAGQIDKGRNMNRLLKGEIESAEQTMSKLVIMIGHAETCQQARSTKEPENTTETVLDSANDLRNTMLGFEDLDLDASPQNQQSTEGLMVDAEGVN
ncbi:MAG: hypothetical protein GY927_20110 [bacterium]|nr:hypothetical protein [bacterium]